MAFCLSVCNSKDITKSARIAYLCIFCRICLLDELLPEDIELRSVVMHALPPIITLFAWGLLAFTVHTESCGAVEFYTCCQIRTSQADLVCFSGQIILYRN